MTDRPTLVLAIVAVLALVVTAVFAAVQTQALSGARVENERLRDDLDEARERIEELEAQVEELRAEAEAPTTGGGETDAFLDVFEDPAALFACLESDSDLERVPEAPAAEQVKVVADQVERLRGLTFDEVPAPTFLTSAEIEARVTGLVLEDYPEADADADRRVLAALGAIPPDTDLRALQADLLAGQVAGFYDPDTGELVVRTADPDQPLRPAELVTLAHELEHAVADQALGLPTDVVESRTDADSALAALALVEGDATMTMQQWALAALSPAEQLALGLDPEAAQAQETLDSYPHVLARGLLFPYEDGLTFACGLHAAGGWSAVDDAYRELPTTTAQILFPQRYADGEGALDVPALGAPGDDWEESVTTTLGAASLQWLFEAPGDDTDAALPDPSERVAAWGGDALRLWTQGDASAVGLAMAEHPRHEGLCEDMSTWYRAAFSDASEATISGDEVLALDGPEQDGIVVCRPGEVLLGIAPDLTTARAIAR